MNETKLSIIIPVYNGAEHIQESISALTAQLQDGVEIIIVNDGSVDTTQHIIESNFALLLKNGIIKLHNQANQGVSAARNWGIDNASGQFIGFVDGDDIVYPDYIANIVSSIDSGADIIEFGLNKFTTSIQLSKSDKTYFSCNVFGHHNSEVSIDRVFGAARWYPCIRAFKSSLFDGVRFPTGIRFCEDLMTIPFLYENSKSIFSIKKPLYGYRVNPDGATLNVRPDYIDNLRKYYQSIPRNGLTRHDYLRMATAFAIYSCARQSDLEIISDAEAFDEFRHLRYSLATYRNLELRRILFHIFPDLFNLLRVAKRLKMELLA